MRKLALLAAAFALTLVASPVMAKPKWEDGQPPGQAKKEGDWTPPGQAKKEGHSSARDSGGLDWSSVRLCRTMWWDAFSSFGECVVVQTWALRNGHDDEEDASEDWRDRWKFWGDGGHNLNGDLRITDVDIDRDGTFTISGEGAEGPHVIVSIGGVSNLVVGYGATERIDSDGSWTVEGDWACQDSDRSHEARFRVLELDERLSTVATFPCQAED
jgi:hypothetical protein